MNSSPSHFQGKDAKEHLKDARLKGTLASSEVHGVEMPGHFSAAADAMKETAVILLLLWIMHVPTHLLLIFSAAFLLWKIGRSATLGWMRLERLHRLIEEERWEIEHHRPQEKEELTELYRAKGLTGKLLEETIETLMADDNRLLKLMLEEELGVRLEVHEHPLKQALGAGVGTLISAGLLLAAGYLFPSFGLPLLAALMVASSSLLSAVLERNKPAPAIVWALSLAFLCAAVVFYLYG